MNQHTTTIRSAVVGVSGYVGRELALILATHPNAELVACFRATARDTDTDVAALHPRLRSITDLPVLPFSTEALAEAQPDVVFLATPHQAAHDLAPAILNAGHVVIDCSAAFRLSDPDIFQAHYGFPHRRPDLIAAAAYGLPELDPPNLATADLIAAPGCYATAAILALAPLVRAGLIAPGCRPVVDAVSGVSGAGKAASDKVHLCEVSAQPYNALAHRHQPEIEEHANTEVSFVPHLAQWDRGILATAHADLVTDATPADLAAAFNAAYAHHPFIRLLGPDHWPAIAAVRESNFADLGWTLDHRGHAVVAVAIDNLVKGAAGQAVQCMNIRFGVPETQLGLRSIPDRIGVPS